MNEIVIEQDCPELSEKEEFRPPQVSCSEKLGRPLKSLGAAKTPELNCNCNCRELRVAPEASLLVSVIVIVGALTFFPVLSLGPVVEELMMRSQGLFG